MRVISWDQYLDTSYLLPLTSYLSITIGVFDGVHLGHQALIQKICSPVPGPRSPIPTIVTFKQNPQKTLNPAAFTGDILSLDQRLCMFESMGIHLVVLIDFSDKFSKITGRDFIDLLLAGRPVKMIALGRNFRCGNGLDTGAEEIRVLADEKGVETWIAPSVLDEGQPVSSSRIRQALAAGQRAEAERMLGRSIESIQRQQ
ncbi:MAG: FAD synthetase family protein [Treponema sp.]|nr:FAD synthetase family protein [Treponema sp.]